MKPFTYIQNSIGEIFTFRTYVENKNCVAKLTYTKNKNKIKEFNLSNPELGYKMIKKEEVKNVYKPIHLSDIKFSFELKELLQNICDKYNCDIYLIGSRLLGYEKDDSDWDFLIEFNKPEVILSELLLNPQIRLFNDLELRDRAKRYSYPNSYYNEKFLLELFQKTCSYIKYKEKEVGIFFSQGKVIDYKVTSLGFKKSILNTKVIVEKSNTYNMPRIICVYCGKLKKEIYIYSLDWLLYGISDVYQKLNFYNLRKINKNTYILDEETGYIKTR